MSIVSVKRNLLMICNSIVSKATTREEIKFIIVYLECDSTYYTAKLKVICESYGKFPFFHNLSYLNQVNIPKWGLSLVKVA